MRKRSQRAIPKLHNCCTSLLMQPTLVAITSCATEVMVKILLKPLLAVVTDCTPGDAPTRENGLGGPFHHSGATHTRYDGIS